MTALQRVERCLQRVREREPVVQAFAFLDHDQVLRAARDRDDASARGPIHGLPIAVKDIIDTEDMPTGYGSPIHDGHRPSLDAACVRILREAGAIIFGKTVTTEFAAFQPGKTRNPHNPAHTPGGSSSGSAAAVAAGMVPVALGTQTAGSVIRPAAFCGVVGFKPGFGRIDTAGVHPFAPSLDTVGMFARKVNDLEHVASALMGAGLTAPNPDAMAVALFRTPWWDQLGAESRARLDQVAGLFDDAGARVADLADPEPPAGFPDINDAQNTIMWHEGATSLAEVIDDLRLSDDLRARLQEGAAAAPEQVDRARRVIADAGAAIDAALNRFDVILTPSAPGEAPRLAATGDPLFNRAWTALGVPAITLPAGTGALGLPLGVQLIGAKGRDARLLAAASWAEAVLARSSL